MFGVRTPTSIYNNALFYQLNYTDSTFFHAFILKEIGENKIFSRR